MILPKKRDPRFITIRRGGTLTDSDHRLLALWAARVRSTSCTSSSRCSLQTRGPARRSSRLGHGCAARSRCLRPARRPAMPWLRQESCAEPRGTPHMLPARRRRWRMSPHTSSVLRPTRSRPRGRPRLRVRRDKAGRLECQWQREQLPDAIRDLVLDDQRLRNDICWSVFDC